MKNILNIIKPIGLEFISFIKFHSSNFYTSKSLEEIYVSTLKHNKEKNIQKIKTGYEKLDALVQGFRSRELILIGSRPAMGKTSLLINLSVRLSKTYPVLFFTYDLSEKLLCSRIISNVLSIDNDEIRSHKLNNLNNSKLNQYFKSIKNSNIYIDSCKNITISHLKRHLRKMILKKGIKIIFIDSIELMVFMKNSLEEDINIKQTSIELKKIAEELNVCIFITSQLKNSVELRGGEKKPTLIDIKQSDVIQNNFDKIIFLYRPEYYGFTVNEEGSSILNEMQLLIIKNKIGATGTVNFSFNNKTSILSEHK